LTCGADTGGMGGTLPVAVVVVVAAAVVVPVVLAGCGRFYENSFFEIFRNRKKILTRARSRISRICFALDKPS
jgi:hypothetical protein